MSETKETDLKEIFRVLSKSKLFILGFTFVVTLLVVVYLLVSSWGYRYYNVKVDVSDFMKDFELVKIPVLIEDVIKGAYEEVFYKVFEVSQLADEGYDLEKLKDNFRVDYDEEDENILEISFLFDDPEKGVFFINTLAEELLIWIMEFRMAILDDRIALNERKKYLYKEEFTDSHFNEEFYSLMDELNSAAEQEDKTLLYLEIIRLAHADIIWQHSMDVRNNLVLLSLDKEVLITQREDHLPEDSIHYAKLGGSAVANIIVMGTATVFTALFISIMIVFLRHFGFSKDEE